MAMNRLRARSFQFEDRQMEGYAASYRAYLAQRTLPGPGPMFADFVEILRLQREEEDSAFNCTDQ
jgi:hypothetical protein